MASLLQLTEVDAAYVRRRILSGVSLALEAGEIVALVGPNGAGKSTVLKSVCGLTTITAGAIELAGQPITGLRPPELLHRGVAYLPQGGQAFGPLTVAENLRVAADRFGFGDAARRVAEVLERSSLLRERWRQRAGSLSGGERQQLAIAMALLGEPKVLLVDEPSIGLAPRLAQAALAAITAVRDESGAGVLLVEQNVSLALAAADRAVLLVSGQVVATHSTAAIAADPELRKQYQFGLAHLHRPW